jgi:ABC-type branched-subunit amino acid transport system ATPase component
MTGPLLEVSSLSKSFGGVVAVDGASFEIAEGSISALIGPNGAGKTTLFNLVSGFIRPDAGSVRFESKVITGWSGYKIARTGLVRTFQTPRILARMSVMENMMLAGQDQIGEQFGMRWLRPRAVERREAEVRERALGQLKLLRLSELADHYAGTLSGGQRKLLDLGRALMVGPRMILLDEPMAGVAPRLAAQLLDHIRELRRDHSVTVCVIEHDMDVVMSISDHVVVMDEGRVIAAGPPEAVQSNERVIEAYLGRLATSKVPAAKVRAVSA